MPSFSHSAVRQGCTYSEAEAVEPVDRAAVSGEQVGKVLDARLPLDRGRAEIADLPRERAEERGDHVHIQRDRHEVSENQPHEDRAQRAEHGAGDRAFDRLLGADRGAELMTAEPAPEEIGERVAERRRKQRGQQDGVEDLVGLHRKVAEAEKQRARIEADCKRRDKVADAHAPEQKDDHRQDQHQGDRRIMEDGNAVKVEQRRVDRGQRAGDPRRGAEAHVVDRVGHLARAEPDQRVEKEDACDRTEPDRKRQNSEDDDPRDDARSRSAFCRHTSLRFRMTNLMMKQCKWY